MAKFRPRATVEAVQLTWNTWSEVCDLIGKFDDTIKGIFIDPFGNAHDHYMGQDAKIGLRYLDSAGREKIAVQDDWIIRGTTGRIFHWPAEAFSASYEPVEPNYNDHPPLS